MRTPSSLSDRWAWWEASISGAQPPTHADDPQSGYFAVRKFPYGEWPKGPLIPARIWWEQDVDHETGELIAPEICRAEIDGRPADPWRIWTWVAKRPIPESEWIWLRALSPLLPKKIPLP